MRLRNLFASAVMALGMTFGGGASAAVIDLGFVLDGSGSVSTTNYNTARTALAQALGQIPTSGTNQYRIAVTSFGTSSGVNVVLPTIVTSTNIAGIQSSVANATKAGGVTNTSGAISYMTSLFANDGGLGDTTLINITTDGAANNSGLNSTNSQLAAEVAALAAWNAGVDGISFEAVGSGVSSASAQNNMARIAGLGTSGLASAGVVLSAGDPIPNATTTGFVIPVSNFEAYSDAINAKIGQVIIDTGGGDPSVVPLPAGMPLMLGVIGAFAFMRRRQMQAS